MEIKIRIAAQDLLASLNSNCDKTAIFDGWKKLVSLINNFVSYESIPYCQEMPIAMYRYVMNYYSKRAEENAIRAITTFGILMNAIENGEDAIKGKYFVCLSLLLSRYKKYFQNSSYYTIFPIKKPTITESFSQNIKDYGNTKAYFDAIKLYIKSIVEDYTIDDFLLAKDFQIDMENFIEEFNNETYDKSQMPNGKIVLYECYEEMNYIGKCPIYVPLPTNAEINNKTFGLIRDDFTFFTNRYFLHETSGKMMEGHLNARVNISITDGSLIINNNGLEESYLRSEICLPIKDVHVRKIGQYLEFTFSESIRRYGKTENVPISLEIHLEHFKIKSLVLTFIVGEKGYLRILTISGNSK